MTRLPDVGDVISGKYEILSQLGSGGMGAVFAARHRLTGKQFAIKWLLPNLGEESDSVQRFMREARVGGRVEHPNVIEVYDVVHENDCVYMVMELLHGETLGDRLKRCRRLSVMPSCQILIHVLRGLDAAHGVGVIHRDLKPHNIFLARSKLGDELPKVLDFGISKIMPMLDESEQSAKTRSGVVIGTPQYMPLEQLRSQPVDERTDVYALGVMLYQMLAGQLPFPADNHADLIVRVATGTVPPLHLSVPDIPVELAQAVAQAMAREPNARFQSARALASALEPFAGELRFSSPSVSPAAWNQVAPDRAPAQVTRVLPAERTPLATVSGRFGPKTVLSKRSRLSLLLVALVFCSVGGIANYAWHDMRRREPSAPADAAPSVDIRATPVAQDSSAAGHVSAPGAALRGELPTAAEASQAEPTPSAAAEAVPEVMPAARPSRPRPKKRSAGEPSATSAPTPEQPAARARTGAAPAIELEDFR